MTDETTESLRPLRLWIPMILVPLMVLARFVPGMIEDAPSTIWMLAAFGPFLLGLLIVLWWVGISRASWKERVLGVLALVVSFGVVVLLVDKTMIGPPLIVMTAPLGIAGFAITLILLNKVLSPKRTWYAALVAFICFGFSALLQNGGVWGDFAFDLDWRWNDTPEDKFFASRSENPSSSSIEDLDKAKAFFAAPEWPGFRGPNRDGVHRGGAFSTELQDAAPEELWRISVGPAWSSFAVAGDYLVTQEQRGDEECVVCYEAGTGNEVWAHSVPSRFFEGLGGLGPRATPTISDGYVYSFGAEGWLMKLDAISGEELWKVDVRKVADMNPPMWGFSSSPLVVDSMVAVHCGGKGDKGILAFDSESGALNWSVASSEQSYGSLQVVELVGTKLMAILTDKGAQFIDPETGKLAFEHGWAHDGYRALQPQVLDGNRVLIPTGLGTGTRLIEVAKENETFVATAIWTSRDLKPDFNDVVVHEGFIYGFDDSIFTCIDLNDGARKWKGGRYGKGQVLLLAESDLLLVLSERGELALLATDPSERKELWKIEAVEGKTWNHPVVVGNRLFIRNAQEAVCYQLPIATAAAESPAETEQAMNRPAALSGLSD
jgi:outer membrane protein assembly factor BamB